MFIRRHCQQACGHQRTQHLNSEVRCRRGWRAGRLARIACRGCQTKGGGPSGQQIRGLHHEVPGGFVCGTKFRHHAGDLQCPTKYRCRVVSCAVTALNARPAGLCSGSTHHLPLMLGLSSVLCFWYHTGSASIDNWAVINVTRRRRILEDAGTTATCTDTGRRCASRCATRLSRCGEGQAQAGKGMHRFRRAVRKKGSGDDCSKLRDLSWCASYVLELAHGDGSVIFEKRNLAKSLCVKLVLHAYYAYLGYASIGWCHGPPAGSHFLLGQL